MNTNTAPAALSMNITGRTDLGPDYSDDGITCPCCSRPMFRACYAQHRDECNARRTGILLAALAA